MGSHTSSPPQLGAHGTLDCMRVCLRGPNQEQIHRLCLKEAIQAEVARQLAGFDQRAQAQDLEIQRMRRQLEEAAQRERALREQVRRETVVAGSAPVAPITRDEVPRPPLQDAQVHTPIAYQVHDAAAQAVEALRAPAQTAAAATSGLWSNFWSGLQGSQRLPSNATPPGRVGQPSSSTAGAQGDSTSSAPASSRNPGFGRDQGFRLWFPVSCSHQCPNPTCSSCSGQHCSSSSQCVAGGTQGPPTSGNTVLDAVLLGVQQLQTLQAQHISSGKKEDAPETVKTGITTFPKLASPDPAGGSLEFQDWLQLIAGLMSDFSDSSQVWWSGVVQVSKDAYDKWVVASPIEYQR